jgi:hypothetical protein
MSRINELEMVIHLAELAPLFADFQKPASPAGTPTHSEAPPAASQTQSE